MQATFIKAQSPSQSTGADLLPVEIVARDQSAHHQADRPTSNPAKPATPNAQPLAVGGENHAPRVVEKGVPAAWAEESPTGRCPMLRRSTVTGINMPPGTSP